jgi:hypothetical protein
MPLHAHPPGVHATYAANATYTAQRGASTTLKAAPCRAVKAALPLFAALRPDLTKICNRNNCRLR